MAANVARRAPMAGRLSNTALLTDLCNDLTAFHAHLPSAETPQSVYDAVWDAHAALIRALRLLRLAAETRNATDPRALTAPPF